MAAVKGVLERELKLDVGPGFRLPDLPGEPIPPRVLTSVYHDTAEHHLARHGVTLRRRSERRRHRWELKLPRGRARLELTLPGTTGPPPPEIARLLVAYTRG
ncbi:MAG: CYTH domain-containing protein, partial [Candidatus Rokubacteria bacterium]|nr:CYTH domain-containing protein [Candidatus Rokubacteria bacterium]